MTHLDDLIAADRGYPGPSAEPFWARTLAGLIVLALLISV